jgi:hypothetical protein
MTETGWGSFITLLIQIQLNELLNGCNSIQLDYIEKVSPLPLFWRRFIIMAPLKKLFCTKCAAPFFTIRLANLIVFSQIHRLERKNFINIQVLGFYYAPRFGSIRIILSCDCWSK